MYDVWNTCFLVPGFSRSECASWAQAWGTVLAIGGAAAIAFFQVRHQQREARRRQADDLLEKCLLAVELVRTLKHFADAMFDRLTSYNAGDARATFQRTAPVFLALPATAFPSPLASRMAGLQFAVSMLLQRIDCGDTETLPLVMKRLSVDCEKTIQRAAELAVKFATVAGAESPWSDRIQRVPEGSPPPPSAKDAEERAPEK